MVFFRVLEKLSEINVQHTVDVFLYALEFLVLCLAYAHSNFRGCLHVEQNFVLGWDDGREWICTYIMGSKILLPRPFDVLQNSIEEN